jgi:hypothetical protein
MHTHTHTHNHTRARQHEKDFWQEYDNAGGEIELDLDDEEGGWMLDEDGDCAL